MLKVILNKYVNSKAIHITNPGIEHMWHLDLKYTLWAYIFLQYLHRLNNSSVISSF